MKNTSGIDQQHLPLPKPGGISSGIGETLNVDSSTGTLNFSLPFSLLPTRKSLSFSLGLSYSSINGNGVFGLGWALTGISVISRKTSKGIPRYLDHNPDVSKRDTFVLSGMGDLVLVEESDKRHHWYQRYRPETENNYALIERRFNEDFDEWQITYKDGTIYTYKGFARDHKIYHWKLAEIRSTTDDRILFTYRDDIENNESYLSDIHYCGYGEGRFLYSIHFDYEIRPDPISFYKAGFPIKTTKRCRRLTMLVHPEDSTTPKQAYYYQLHYNSDALSLLTKVELIGLDVSQKQESIQRQAPLELKYQSFNPEQNNLSTLTFNQEVGPGESPQNTDLTIIDLFATGLPSFLHTTEHGYYYWENQGDLKFSARREFRFAPPHRLSEAGVTLADIDGDGRMELMVSRAQTQGYYRLTFEEKECPWHPYRFAPTFKLDDADVRMFDTTGNGVTDAVQVTANNFIFFNNDGRKGWQQQPSVQPKQVDISFDPTNQTFRLADMNGDGMQDIVMLDQGKIDYWPNMGYGRYGERITLDLHSVLPVDYIPENIFLADIDGNGCADCIYVEHSQITIWMNVTGSRFLFPQILYGMPSSHGATMQMVDLKGNGTVGLLYSYPTKQSRENSFQFIDFSSGKRPYLLTEINNHRGAIKHIEYKPSTAYYLKDKRQGLTWQTSLPFPLQCVDQVRTCEQFTGNKLIRQYNYHHGHWDGYFREFYGFACVDMIDTERFRQPQAQDYAPPLLTRHWFHLGLELRHDNYWPGDLPELEQMLSEQINPLSGKTSLERHAILRAMLGKPLRQETYALDGSRREHLPLTVNAWHHQLKIEDESKLVSSIHRFCTIAHQKLQYTAEWARGHEPRVSMHWHETYDSHGNLLASYQILLPRLHQIPWSHALTESNSYHIRRTLLTYAEPLDPKHHLLNKVSSSTEYQIPDRQDSLLSLLASLTLSATLPSQDNIIKQTLYFYDGAPYIGLELGSVGASGLLTRELTLALTEAHIRQAYQSRPVYFNTAEHRTYPVTMPMTSRALGYLQFSAQEIAAHSQLLFQGYYIHSKRYRYGPFASVEGALEPLSGEVSMQYDPYHLFVIHSTQLNLITQAEHDYSAAQPTMIEDANGNRTLYRYTPLGLLYKVVKQGKLEEAIGDTEAYPTIIQHYQLQIINGQPTSVSTIQRTQHLHIGEDHKKEPTLRMITYSDGFGRILQKRNSTTQVKYGDNTQSLLPSEPSPLEDKPIVAEMVQERVRVSHLHQYDNKGHVMMVYQPYFATGWEYEPPSTRDFLKHHFRDATGRICKTVFADHSIERTIYGEPLTNDLSLLDDPDQILPNPWTYYQYDANDLDRAHPFYNTPSIIETDIFKRILASTEILIKDGLRLRLSQYAHYDLNHNPTHLFNNEDRLVFHLYYDLLQNELSTQHLDAEHKTEQVFNAASLVVDRRQGPGSHILRTYTQLQHLKSRWFAKSREQDGFACIESFEYGYEGKITEPQAKARNALDRIIRIHDGAGTVSFGQYDFKYNLTEMTRTFFKTSFVISGEIIDWEQRDLATHLAARSYQMRYNYDALDRRRRIIFPDSSQAQNQYNRQGKLHSLHYQDSSIINEIIYNASDQQVMTVFGNQHLLRNSFDRTHGRLIRSKLQLYRESSAGYQLLIPTFDAMSAVVFHDSVLTHDGIGNTLTRQTRVMTPLLQSHRETFVYDSLYRLQRATGTEHSHIHSAQLQSVIDDNPNALQDYERRYRYTHGHSLQEMRCEHPRHQSSTYTRQFSFFAERNQVKDVVITHDQSQSEINYNYNDRGSLIAEGVRDYHWRQDEMLQQVTDGHSNSFFCYGYQGRRGIKVEIRDGSISTRLYIADLFEVHTQDGETTTTAHLRAQKNRIALARTHAEHTKILYHHTDHTRSSVLVSAADGLLQHYETYAPFGETTLSLTLNESKEDTHSKRFRFNGKEQDASTSHYDYGARCYSPSLSRWLSLDPIFQLRKSISMLRHKNGYTFSKNNPIVFFDPDGRVERCKVGTLDTVLDNIRSLEAQARARLEGKYNGKALIREINKDVLSGWWPPDFHKKFNKPQAQYFYTERYGIIDVPHFLYNAKIGAFMSDGTLEPASLFESIISFQVFAITSYGNELYQGLVSPWLHKIVSSIPDSRSSFFTKEDLSSNMHGFFFGDLHLALSLNFEPKLLSDLMLSWSEIHDVGVQPLDKIKDVTDSVDRTSYPDLEEMRFTPFR